MDKLKREDIYTISPHSNLAEKGVYNALKENIYNDGKAWQKFLSVFLFSLGVGFTLSGIVFFFAYNWAGLHKFVKIGLIAALIIAAICLVLLSKINNVRRVALSGAALLAGVLFAVFGQIYQTGANAYDFFLAWTVFVTLWVVVSNFAPLWLLYLGLINTTLVLYAQQVARHWSGVSLFALLFAINTLALIAAILLSRYRNAARIPNWFLNTVALGAAGCATIGIVLGIFSDYEISFVLLAFIAALAFALGIWHGLRTKSGFYLSIIPFSLIVIGSALLIKLSEGEAMFLLVGVFIISSTTLVIKNLIGIQKRWANEK